MGYAGLLAHMGGIDEIGIFVIPAVLAIFALRWAEKRARAKAEPSATAPDGGEEVEQVSSRPDE